MALIADDTLDLVNSITDDAARVLDGALGVEVVRIGNRTFAYVAARYDDGISILEVAADGSVGLLNSIGDVGATALNGAAGLASVTIGTDTYLYVSGEIDDGISVFRVRADGGLDFVESVFDDATLQLDGTLGRMCVVTNDSGRFLVATGFQDDGISVFQIAADGTLTNTGNINDAANANLALNGALDVATATVAGNTYVFASAFQEHGITAFRLESDGTLTRTDSVSDSPSLELLNAYGLATATVGANTFLFAAGQSDHGISVFSVTPDGQLLNVFNLADTIDLGLNGVRGLSVFQLGGQLFLAASGALDQAINYFRIEANGALTIVDTLFEDPTTELIGATYTDFVEIGGTGYILSIGHDDDGISSFGIGLGDTTLNGTGQADQIFGYGGDDILNGLAGTDLLDGGSGSDQMAGGAGNDTYIVDRQSDAVTETAGNGTSDHIRAKASYVLAGGADVERLSAYFASSTSSLNLTGNLLSQEIIGNAGANTLTDGGAGGAGDILRGLGGNDTYRVFSAATTIQEGTSQGTADRIIVAVDYVLGSGVQVERMTTNGSTGTSGIDLTGNLLSQQIVGNNGVNILTDGGAGGAGDQLQGLGGSDVYRVYSTATTVQEGAGQGTADTVAAGVSYSLGSGEQVERLTTTNSAGSAAINLTGNEFAQQITGNAGANTLSTGGGAADVMRGLNGNDTYRVYNSADIVHEGSLEGAFDRIVSAVDYVLGSGVHVEWMTTNGSTGISGIDLSGNEIAQQIVGNAGSNIINGRGGNDTLIGLGGNDFFVFSTALGSGNVDAIMDYNVAADTIRLENAIFTALTATGILAPAAFRANTTGLAQDSSDRIIYETDTGELYYDANGTGAGGGVLFATMAANLALTNADFAVV